MGWGREEEGKEGGEDEDEDEEMEEGAEPAKKKLRGGTLMPPPLAKSKEELQKIADDAVALQRLAYDAGSMSPPRLSSSECERASEEIVDEEEDMQLLLQLRAQVEYHASGKFRAARDMLPGSSSSEAEGIYQQMLKPGQGPRGVPVMLRNLAAQDEAAATFRSGAALVFPPVSSPVGHNGAQLCIWQ